MVRHTERYSDFIRDMMDTVSLCMSYHLNVIWFLSISSFYIVSFLSLSKYVTLMGSHIGA